MEVLKSAYYIISFSTVLCDTFSKDTDCLSHIADWFDFRCCVGFGENNKSAVKMPPVTARSRLFPTNSQPLASNALEKLTVSIQECRNLRVSSCTGTLIAKDKEFNSNLLSLS